MSDLISRDNLSKYKEKLGCNEPIEVDAYYGGWNNAIDCIIENEPPAQQWIPCSERLPVDDDYRESMECLDGCVWYFTDKGSMGLGHYYYSTRKWFTLRNLKPDGKVIAWMPVPEPYKGGDT